MALRTIRRALSPFYLSDVGTDEEKKRGLARAPAGELESGRRGKALEEDVECESSLKAASVLVAPRTSISTDR